MTMMATSVIEQKQNTSGPSSMIASNLVPRIPKFLRRHRLIQGLLRIPGQTPLQLVRFHNGHRAYADLRDGFMRLILIDGGYDPDFFRIASPFLKVGGHYLDVGANYGFCSFGLSGVAEAGRIAFHMIEANADLIPILRISANLYPGEDLRIVHACATNRPGMSHLNVDRQQTGASFVSDDGECRVKNMVIDEYLREQNIDRVALMKMDIEGHEFSALQGAQAALKSGKIDAIYLEVFPKWLQRSGLCPDDLIGLLESNGYRLYFCRRDDPNIQPSALLKPSFLRINEANIEVWRVSKGSIRHNTDILAVYGDRHNRSANLDI